MSGPVQPSMEVAPGRRPGADPWDRAATSLRILLVGNYPADRQESMLRFAGMLREGLADRGIEVEVLAPRAFFGRLRPAGTTMGKWLGYVDKYVLFPAALRRRLWRWRRTSKGSRSLVHICDHSNAPYVAHTGRVPCVVTCHDLGAVRGAFGEATDCPASATGKVLQRWILRSLVRADRVVCDSTATRNDLARLLGSQAPRSEVVLLGLNQPFAPRPPDEIEARLCAVLPNLDRSRPFVLHVGSSLARKNREGVLRIFDRLCARWDGQLVFAGEAPPPELQERVRELGLSERVLVVERPDSALLEALYHTAFALLFPSRFEGFGWPVIEAQACGCPVVCSDASSLPEVAGAGALLRAVDDEAGFVDDLLSLSNPAIRAALVERGLANLSRFETRRMIDDYLSIYRQVATSA